jgi:hypothetical protein
MNWSETLISGENCFLKSEREMWTCFVRVSHFSVSCGWDVARMGEKRIVYRLLVGKPEGKRPLGRPRRRWTDNIKMDFLEI